jgi:hypothetical protein
MKRVTTAEERKDMIEQLGIARGQIDCTMMQNETARELDLRLDKLQKRFEKPLERYDENQKRPNALRKLKLALNRAKDARKVALCDNETLIKFEKYVNETLEKIDRLNKDGPLDQPSFLANEMKERENEILNKIAEIKRPPKKVEVVNFSTENESQYDEGELERLRSLGVVLNSDKKKRNRKKDEDPKIKAEKEAKLLELETTYNASRHLFNESKKEFCQYRAAYERHHHLISEPCEYPSETSEKYRFKEEEEYDERLQRRVARKAERLETQRLLDEEEQRRIEEEAKKPSLSPEEVERIAREKEEIEREREIIESSRLALERER